MLTRLNFSTGSQSLACPSSGPRSASPAVEHPAGDVEPVYLSAGVRAGSHRQANRSFKAPPPAGVALPVSRMPSRGQSAPATSDELRARNKLYPKRCRRVHAEPLNEAPAQEPPAGRVTQGGQFLERPK